MKYVQKVIPEATTPEEWRGKKIKELRKIINTYIKENLVGKLYQNIQTDFPIHITSTSARKTAYGEAMYYDKATALLVLPQILQYATYNNFGQRKETDDDTIFGYANFKCKVKINGKLKTLRIAVKIAKGGFLYYNIEVNKIFREKK